MPRGRFSFLGFLPKKAGERKKVLERYKDFDGVKIVYESPFRLIKLIEEIKNICGEKTQISISREMTKKFEEIIGGSAEEVFQKIKDKNIKGEIVVIFE
jgi:16S rRNA (cytidine1402-2'-O)-methyltransferase